MFIIQPPVVGVILVGLGVGQCEPSVVIFHEEVLVVLPEAEVEELSVWKAGIIQNGLSFVLGNKLHSNFSGHLKQAGRLPA